MIDEEILRLENKYEIESLNPNEEIENWFEEFEKDVDNLIQKALKLREKEILEKFKMWALKEFGMNVSQSPKFRKFEEELENANKQK